MIMENKVADKRLFFLMLSIAQGQSFANFMGFAVPSKDVAEAETFDIASRWALFVSQGLAESVEETASWMIDLLQKSDKLGTPQEEVLPLFASYGMALLNRLLENGNISIVINEETLEDWMKEKPNDD
jgi:hypothetical protein